MTLLEAPSIPKQPFCCCCGRTDLPIEQHHVVHRSRGGHDGPTIPICKACHMAHHDDGTLRFAYLHGEWYALDDYSHWPLKVYNEHEQSCPVSTEEVLAGATDELRELMTLKSNAEYLVAALLARLDVPRTYLEDWLIDEFGFHRSAVGGYLTKNLAYGQLSAKGAEGLGLTRGHQVAHLVSLGYDIDKVLHDYHTMPREQWLREYQV